MPQLDPSHQTAHLLPPWLQNDSFFKNLPEQHQQAIRDIIQPLYDRFVLQPADHLERATGNSVIYLLWSELLKQAEIANSPFDADQLRRRVLMDDLFLILGPKSKMSSLLVRLRQVKSDPQHDEPTFHFPLPPPTLGIGETQSPLTNTNPIHNHRRVRLDAPPVAWLSEPGLAAC